jgi:glutathione peroxidase
MKLPNFLSSFFKPDEEEFPELSVHKLELKTLEGDNLPLRQFKGKKLLIVNVASECGLTPQYEQLQQLYDKYNDKLEILGVPCNDFAGQEPGVPQQIRDFCTTKYDITFTLSEKVNIKTDPIHPLYDFLTRKDQNNYLDTIVEWNFQKYLLNETGELIAVFPPPVNPTSEEVISML